MLAVAVSNLLPGCFDINNSKDPSVPSIPLEPSTPLYDTNATNSVKNNSGIRDPMMSTIFVAPTQKSMLVTVMPSRLIVTPLLLSANQH